MADTRGGTEEAPWTPDGTKLRDSIRLVYFNGQDGRIWLLIAYKKAKFDNLPTESLARLKKAVEHG